jgi:hypothetical protein
MSIHSLVATIAEHILKKWPQFTLWGDCMLLAQALALYFVMEGTRSIAPAEAAAKST